MSTAEILNDIRERKDVALKEWTLKLDGSEFEIAKPSGNIPTDAIIKATDAIKRWHAAQRPADVELEVNPGVTLFRRWVPLERIGIYVPKNLISSLLMAAIPAQVAGVKEFVICTPPQGASLIAKTAELLNLGPVWSLGGPPAIAAMAYGTESIPKVDKIFGPGGKYVNEAKLIASQSVPIDLAAGPSEVCVVVDDAVSSQRLIDLELKAQGEHGDDSICNVVVFKNEQETLEMINRSAPEHVALIGPKSEALARKIQNAGAIFVGPYSPVPAGDYATGGNHVLPTGGWARSVGGLGLESFMKPLTEQRITEEGLENLKSTIFSIAQVEGMINHALATNR